MDLLFAVTHFCLVYPSTSFTHARSHTHAHTCPFPGNEMQCRTTAEGAGWDRSSVTSLLGWGGEEVMVCSTLAVFHPSTHLHIPATATRVQMFTDSLARAESCTVICTCSHFSSNESMMLWHSRLSLTHILSRLVLKWGWPIIVLWPSPCHQISCCVCVCDTPFLCFEEDTLIFYLTFWTLVDGDKCPQMLFVFVN